MHVLPNKLGALVTALLDRLDGQFEPYSHSAAAALLTLLYRERLPVTQLAHILRLSQPAATRVVDRLETGGLLSRIPEAGRAVPVRLTAVGRQAAQTLQDRRLALCAGALSPLSQEERDAFDHILSKVLAGLVEDRGLARQICRLCDHAACDGPLCPVGCAARAIEGDRARTEPNDADRA